VHQVTGDMTLRWLKATHGDLAQWSAQLRTVADAMAQAAQSAPAEAVIVTADNAAAGGDDTIPDWLVEATADMQCDAPDRAVDKEHWAINDEMPF
jgi:hypothetical protein